MNKKVYKVLLNYYFNYMLIKLDEIYVYNNSKERVIIIILFG
jgi:hypothetical protein